MLLGTLRSSATAGHNSRAKGFGSQAAQPHLEDGSTYHPLGPPNWTKSRTFTLRFKLELD